MGLLNTLQDYLRAEMLGLHFVRDKIISSDYKIRVGGDQVGSVSVCHFLYPVSYTKLMYSTPLRRLRTE